MRQISGKRKIGFTVLGALLLLLLWTVWGNVTVGTTVYDLHDDKLPAGFAGYRIAQVSDLHNAVFGKDNARLLSILRYEQPDIIVLTGDLVDANHTNIDAAVDFAARAVQLAPCYYVTGNHEAWLGARYEDLEQRLRACGVTVLRNETVSIAANGDTVRLIGIDDPDFTADGMDDEIISAEITEAGVGEGYKILLSHRPEVFSTYVEQGINLALCGHAHGGQFRLPFVGGLVAPNQGLLPEYDSGVYREKDTAMIVSRGVGNSIIPVRFNNRPEVVIVVLHQ